MFNFFKNKTFKKEFPIIKLVAGQAYYPASLEGSGNSLSSLEGLLPEHILNTIEIDIYENALIHTKIDLPLGKSRYGGPIIDIPINESIPENLNFAAQLNLKELSPYDKLGLLPKTGHLLIFSDIRTGTGKIIYSDVDSSKLVRKIKEHSDDFYMGVMIEKAYESTERWEERFRKPEDEWEEKELKDLVNKDGLLWDSFAGSDTSKIFGILTHCQYSNQEIEEFIKSDNLVLLQIGEDSFNDEGVFSVTISKKDLIKKNFNNCSFHWGQS